ncbi:MAG: PhzF family phenazine biosynthesis protein [Planctomycetes bacterium]|nr:PhzF family phenazine biosynthesis protein [Planctomycetota bacterium]
MATRIHQVDAFTDTAFRGNPAGVCVLNRAVPEAWMQSVAGEMNLSETAFLSREESAWRLRWFTPKVEVELCGHATLASAHVLFETGVEQPEATIRFRTLSGELRARRNGERIELDFPRKAIEERAAPPGLIDALGERAVFVGRNDADWLVELESEERVRACAPDFARLKAVKARGVIITARSRDARFDCVSRFFAPSVGIDEDPVTGSAHCAIGPYWAAKLERKTLVAYQASCRGGVLHLEIRDDRVKICGSAVTTLRGELLVDPA